MQAVLRTVYTCLPPPTFPGSDLPPPVGINERRRPGRHTKPAAEEDNDDDKISFLPDNLRHEILSRLPIRDAVRTAALSRRWRRHGWTSAPLHLDDGHLVRISDHDQRVQRLSRLLLSHPGPFRRVRLVFTPFGFNPAALRLWVSLLADKRVEELVLVNRPLPVDMGLPPDILRCTSLKRLHLGFFAFPSTGAAAYGFGELTELGLYCVVMASRDLSHVLRCSPKLEKLSIVANYGNIGCVGVCGHKKLRSVVVWSSVIDEICVQDAEQLERLVLCGVSSSSSRDSGLSVRIDRAPSLRVLGYLEPGVHSLVIGDSVIQLGTKISPHTMVPSVRVLGLRVPFGDKRRSKLLPAFLRCFPNVDTLHIESTETNEPNGKLNLAYWQKLCGDITCVDEHIKRILIHNFRGEVNELAFLKFLFGNASALEAMVIILSEECLDKIDNVWDKLTDLGSTKRASENPRLLVTENSSPPSFEMALDFSTRDPFSSIDDFISERLQEQVGLEAEVEPTVILSSGHIMPVVGLGVWQMVDGTKQHAICDLMSAVIAMGYRHFDCTSDFDTEMKIGKALQEACQTQLVKRKDLFITIQVPYKNPGNVIEICKRTLRNLQLDYVDLYIVSIPHSGVDDGDTAISLERTWNAMEELVSMGLVNSIGISNCDIPLIRDLLAYAKINPAVSQIKVHPYLQRDPLVGFCQKHEMCVMAPNPDCDGLEPFLNDVVIKDLAKKYSKTPAQVVLRWGLQRSMMVISDISRVDVLNDSLSDLFDFNISAEDMKLIKSLDRT